MSLSHDKDNHYIPKLTRANWTTWIEYVRDYIYALDADDAPDIWNAFKWVQPEGGQEADPADKDYQQATNANAKKLRMAHNKAYRFIRQHLSADVFEKIKGQEVNVPKLVRFLRNYWFDGSVSDRNRMRLEFLALRLGDYADMDLYIDTFKAQAMMCRGAKIGMAQTDDDVLFRLNESLPAAWEQYKAIVSASKMSLEDACSFYLKTAREMGVCLAPARRAKGLWAPCM